jgi:hypothetical protein
MGFMRLVHRDRNDYPLYAVWLGGFGRRISGNDRQPPFPDKRRSSPRRFIFPAQTGFNKMSLPARLETSVSHTGPQPPSSEDVLRRTA